MTREATSTIKGYFYQFDLTILELLKLTHQNSTVTIEGAEDIDLNDVTTTAIQCKYYESTEYNHSVIAKPIRLMLKDFSDRITSGKPKINYKLYGYYKKGQGKLTLPLTTQSLIKNFLTYSIKKLKKEEHKILSLSASQLQAFISSLTIDINADEFSMQLKKVLREIKKEFNCNDFEAEHLYYANSIVKIKELSILKSITKRTVKRKDFLKSIDNKDVLHKNWFTQIKERDKHLRAIKKEYFTSLNTSPYERFFIIEKSNKDTIQDLLEITKLIVKKYSKLRKKEPNPFCPSIHFKGLTKAETKSIMKTLFKSDYIILDGYPFKDASLNTEQLSICPNYYNQIKLKFLHSINDFKKYKSKITKTIEIYQFYVRKPFYKEVDKTIKHIQIQIDKTSTIKQII